MRIQKNSLLSMMVIAVVFTLLGAGLTIWLGWPKYQLAKASAAWPTTTGRIVTSRVDDARDSKGKRSYSASVNFTYNVLNHEYLSDQIWAGGGYSSSSKPAHEQVVSRYPVGSEVPVYYDPQKPQQGILVPGLTWMNYVLLGIGGVFFFTGLLFGIGSVFVILRRIL